MGNNRPTSMIRAPGNTSSILLSWYPDQCSMIATSDLVTWVRRSSELAGWLWTPECTLSVGHRWNLKKGRQCNEGNLTFAGGGSSVHAWAHGGQWTKCEERSDQVGPDPESWRNYKVGEVLGTSWLVDRFPDFTFMRVMQQKNCFLLNAFIYPTFWNDQLGLNSFFSGTSHGLARPPHTR